MYASAAAQLKLNCNIGPITRSYGGTNWLVYSCDDHHSLIFLSAPDNPGAPFYFLMAKQESGYQLNGEGTGNKDATGAAFADLKKLSEQEIASLIEQTKSK